MRAAVPRAGLDALGAPCAVALRRAAMRYGAVRCGALTIAILHCGSLRLCCSPSSSCSASSTPQFDDDRCECSACTSACSSAAFDATGCCAACVSSARCTSDSGAIRTVCRSTAPTAAAEAAAADMAGASVVDECESCEYGDDKTSVTAQDEAVRGNCVLKGRAALRCAVTTVSFDCALVLVAVRASNAMYRHAWRLQSPPTSSLTD